MEETALQILYMIRIIIKRIVYVFFHLQSNLIYSSFSVSNGKLIAFLVNSSCIMHNRIGISVNIAYKMHRNHVINLPFRRLHSLRLF